jgi:hypothetical protein
MRDSPLELFSLRAGFIGLAMALFSVGSMAQRPPPSLFKCEEGGVVRYSDAPCQDGVKLQLGRSRDPASAPQVGSQTRAWSSTGVSTKTLQDPPPVPRARACRQSWRKFGCGRRSWAAESWIGPARYRSGLRTLARLD